MTTLADRNNNPGNIEWGSPWYGLRLPPKEGGRFCEFIHPIWGWRAMFRIITDDAKRGMTVRKIVHQWAPPEDGNDVDAYVRSIQKTVGLQPGVKPQTSATVRALVVAMAVHEGFPRHRILTGDVVLAQLLEKRGQEQAVEMALKSIGYMHSLTRDWRET